MNQIAQEADQLRKTVGDLLDSGRVSYELEAVDVSHAESLWYELSIRTKPGSGLKLACYLFREAIGVFCNDYRIFLCLEDESFAKKPWLEFHRQVISALIRPEIRVRGRRSWFFDKIAALWLMLPEGGRWVGDAKACRGAGQEYVFKNWRGDPGGHPPA